MEILLLILLIVIGFVTGIIPIGGTVYGFVVIIMGEIFGWEAAEMLIIMVAVLIGSIVGTVLGYMLEVASLGFIWFWSRGSFSNITATLAQIGALAFDIIVGMSIFAVMFGLGLVVFHYDKKHLPKKCVSVLGKDFCVGSD